MNYRPLSLEEKARCRRRLRAESHIVRDVFLPLGPRTQGCHNCGKRTAMLWHYAEWKGFRPRNRSLPEKRRWRAFRLCEECCRHLSAWYDLPPGKLLWPPEFKALKRGRGTQPRKRVLIPGKVRPKRYSWSPAPPKKRKRPPRWPTPG